MKQRNASIVTEKDIYKKDCFAYNKVMKKKYFQRYIGGRAKAATEKDVIIKEFCFGAKLSERKKGVQIFDSGATNHMCNDKKLFKNIVNTVDGDIMGANGQNMQ